MTEPKNPSEKYGEDFFVFNKFLLKIPGVWRPESQNVYVQKIFAVYSILIFSVPVFYFTIAEYASLAVTYKNEYDLIKNLSFALIHSTSIVKFFFWYFKSQEVLDIIQTLQDKELHYEPYDHFQPGILFENCKRTGIKYTLYFYILAQATLGSSYIPPFVETLKNLGTGAGNATVLMDRRMPYYSWMPFSHVTSWKHYFYALLYQAIPMYYHCYYIVGMDTLFMNIMNCIGGHLSIIQGAFLTIRERSCKKIGDAPFMTPDGLHNSDELMTAMRYEMKKTCKHLETIFNVCEHWERLQTYPTLSQTLATLFILCTCLYLVSMTPIGSKQFFNELFYMGAIGVQFVSYCLFGNEITLKAADMPTYLWQSDWLAADTDYKKSMIQVMVRCKKPVYMTVGKFANLTLATFMSTIKASYSAFSLIKNSGHTN